MPEQTSDIKDPCQGLTDAAYADCSENYAGGRRRRGSRKAHKGGKRRGNASLRAWVTFVKKVQKEEGIGYKEAMTVAKKRKDKGEKWRGGGDYSEDDMEPTGFDANEEMDGGRRRRRRTHKRRGSKRHSKRRGTRRHRR